MSQRPVGGKPTICWNGRRHSKYNQIARAMFFFAVSTLVGSEGNTHSYWIGGNHVKSASSMVQISQTEGAGLAARAIRVSALQESLGNNVFSSRADACFLRQASSLVLSLRGGRNTRKPKKHAGAKDYHGQRNRPPGEQDDSTPTVDGQGVEDMQGFDRLEKLLWEDPRMAEFANQLMSDPKFQTLADDLLSDPKAVSLLKTHAELPLNSSSAIAATTPNRNLTADQLLDRLSLSDTPTNETNNKLPQHKGTPSARANGSNHEGTEGGVGGGDVDEETGGKFEDTLGELMSATSKAMANRWSEDKDKAMQSNPVLAAISNSEKLAAIQADLQANGPMAVLKYAKDPEALKMFEQIVQLTMQ